jgi:hypothetical protein
VKNVPLKCYFSLPYFVMIFIELDTKIKAEETKIEAALFQTMQTAYDNDFKLFESVKVTDLEVKKPEKVTK